MVKLKWTWVFLWSIIAGNLANTLQLAKRRISIFFWMAVKGSVEVAKRVNAKWMTVVARWLSKEDCQ